MKKLIFFVFILIFNFYSCTQESDIKGLPKGVTFKPLNSLTNEEMELYKVEEFGLKCMKIDSRTQHCQWANGSGYVECDGGTCGLLVSASQVCLTCKKGENYTQGEGACHPSN
ncbi:MAG: hypothetical protein IPG55_11580 [Saprospiraceae bacterium]|nr:hypothetical protein [Candidatus Defluviibacterium haderslevense]